MKGKGPKRATEENKNKEYECILRLRYSMLKQLLCNEMKFNDRTRSTIRFSFIHTPLTYFTQYTTVWFSFLLTFHINIDNENVSSSESYMNHPPPQHIRKNIITVLCSIFGPNKIENNPSYVVGQSMDRSNINTEQRSYEMNNDNDTLLKFWFHFVV